MNPPFITEAERQAIGRELFERTRERFSGLTFARVEEHPEIFSDSWLIVYPPPDMSEDTIIEMQEYATTITTDILLRAGRYVGLHVEEELIAA